MFDIGFSELVLIGFVALIVLGPERLPKAARFVGLWVRRARAQWYSVRGELERELAADELKRSLRETQAAVEDIDAQMRQAGADARREFEAMRTATATNNSDTHSSDTHGDAYADTDPYADASANVPALADATDVPATGTVMTDAVATDAPSSDAAVADAITGTPDVRT